MGLVFFSLTIILLVIVALNRLFGPKEANLNPPSLAEVGQAQEASQLDRELVAAVSAAIAILAEEARLEKEPRARLVAATRGASLWKTVARPQLLDARDLKRRKW